MSLSLYKKKRRFEETPEPKGKEKSSQGLLKFVVQKHDASHLHYDFRLEMDGVLKSWAVPKGPSLNPQDKRLAMMVEDHPYDYRDFEGIIPEGNYGGGTVIVWDEGTYEPMGAEGKTRKEQEKMLLKQLHSGDLKIILHGKKLKGAFALFLMKGRGERSWLLVKKVDEHATDKNVVLQNKSVKTGKTLDKVAREHGTEVNHPGEDLGVVPKSKGSTKKSPSAKKTAPAKKKVPAKTTKKQTSAIVKKILGKSLSLASKSKMPVDVVPMLATLVDAPFDDREWLYEIKWDGYRAVAYCDLDKVSLVSRNLTPFTEKYYPIADALKELELEAVFDGEIVAVNDKGMAVFQSLQNWQNTPVQLVYYVFDILWLNGYDLKDLPLLERKRILETILPSDHETIKYSDHIVGEGNAFFEAAVKQGLEGIMAKKTGSKYAINTRSADWLKIKSTKRQEVVIAGFTQPRNSRKNFGALLLGLYEGDDLVYVGHTGTGFNSKGLDEVYQKLVPLVTEKCPFVECPKGNMPVTWVKPKIVGEIKFSEWTKERIARHPVFMGLRTDKKPKHVIFEKAAHMTTRKKTPAKKTKTLKNKTAARAVKKTAAKKQASGKAGAKKSAAKKATKKNSAKPSGLQLDLSAGNDQLLAIGGQELKLTNLNKQYWKKEKFSKGDMINYYLKIAPYMLPYMLNRPQSLNRHPDGIDGPSFYQKNQTGKVPQWMQTFKDYSESTGENVEYLVCSDEATLVYMANLGCIEMHPWHSRVQSPQNPDWCLVDLDPDDANSYEQVMEVARVVKKLLDAIGAEACIKTSGSSGMHIFIPLGAKYNFDQSKQLAELIVTLVNHELPGFTSVERKPAKRKGKIYLDYLQNRQTQTAAAAYSLRPKPGVPVSTPLDWSELKKGLTPTTYNAKNIFDRLKVEGDLFTPVLGKGIQLEKVLNKISVLLK